MEPRSHGGGSFHDEEELLAAVGQATGPEAAETARRSLQLARNPQALTDAERAELLADLEPVLQDMRSSSAIVPDVLEQAHEYCVQSPDGAGSPWSIRVQASLPPPERLAGLADQLQEWEIEELAATRRPATWPQCPQHPDTHPLAPRARNDQAVWCCPASGQVISVIGALRPRPALPASFTAVPETVVPRHCKSRVGRTDRPSTYVTTTASRHVVSGAAGIFDLLPNPVLRAPSHLARASTRHRSASARSTRHDPLRRRW